MQLHAPASDACYLRSMSGMHTPLPVGSPALPCTCDICSKASRHLALRQTSLEVLDICYALSAHARTKGSVRTLASFSMAKWSIMEIVNLPSSRTNENSFSLPLRGGGFT